jgi:cell division protein FtsL
MSTLGKVLVFINLVLAVAFLVCAIQVLNQQETYRQKLEAEQTAHKTDKDKDAAEIARLTGDVDNKRNTISARDAMVSSLQNDRDQFKARAEAAEAFKNAVSEKISAMEANLDNYRKSNDDLTKAVAEARTEAEKARADRDAAKKGQEDAENKLAQSEESNKQLTGTVNQLMAQSKKQGEELAAANNALDVYASRTGIPREEVYNAAPSISGNVVNVAMDAKLIQLNVGSDSNVKKGFGFVIYRGSEYKGEVIVEDVQSKFATARIRSMVKQIAVGDQARSGIF